MTDEGGRGGNEPGPYFFLSYAHTPVHRTVGDPNPDLWVHRFFDDLCRFILQITDLPSTAEIGFMDRDMRPGEPWPDRLSDALARCRVFVPLYSPRYFRSVNCGQEWHAFGLRPVYQRKANGGHHSGVVPVLWVPQDPEALPRAASRLQFKHADFGPAYAVEGLFPLMKLGYFRDAYEMAVYRLAKRIVEVAAQTMIPVDEVERDYQALPSAFETTDTGRELRISVLAGDLSKRPPGRAPGCYGPRPVDWQPYDPGPSGRSLAEHAARVARQLDFTPSIHTFEEEAEGLRRGVEPTAPGLLLLDRWALQDPEKRRLAEEFDQLNPSWISLMEPWCENDPDRERGERDLASLAAETFRAKRREAKPSLRGAFEGLPTIESFSAELPRAAQRAMHGFDDRRKPASVAKSPAPTKPSLRDARPNWQQVDPWRAAPPALPAGTESYGGGTYGGGPGYGGPPGYGRPRQPGPSGNDQTGPEPNGPDPNGPDPNGSDPSSSDPGASDHNGHDPTGRESMDPVPPGTDDSPWQQHPGPGGGTP